jgi:hypothetical protein
MAGTRKGGRVFNGRQFCVLIGSDLSGSRDLRDGRTAQAGGGGHGGC